MVEDKYYVLDNESPKPIFLYTCGEGTLQDAYTQSGFVTRTLAEQFGALVVFVEHRYFG